MQFECKTKKIIHDDLYRGIGIDNQVVLCLLRRSLFGSEEALPIAMHLIDWHKVHQISLNHDVVIFAYDGLMIQEKNALSQELLQRWKQAVFSSFNKNQAILDAQRDIVNLFNHHSIDYCIIKGFVSASYYGNKAMYRQEGDIDIVIKPEDSNIVNDILNELGYTVGKTMKRHTEYYNRSGIEVELHIGGYSSVRSEYTICSIENVEFRTHDVYGRLEWMILHLQYHWKTGIGLRHLCDCIMMLSNISKDPEFLNIYNSLNNQHKKFFDFFSTIAIFYFEIEIYTHNAVRYEKDHGFILREILVNGSWGRNNKNNLIMKKLSDLKQKNSTIPQKIQCFIQSTSNHVSLRKKLPENQILRKVTLMWYVIYIYAKDIREGNRKLNLVSGLLHMRKREEMYKKAGLV